MWKGEAASSPVSPVGSCTEWTWQLGPQMWLHVGPTRRLPHSSLIRLSALLSACLPCSQKQCWALSLDVEVRKPVNHLVESDYTRPLLSHWEQWFLLTLETHRFTRSVYNACLHPSRPSLTGYLIHWHLPLPHPTLWLTKKLNLQQKKFGQTRVHRIHWSHQYVVSPGDMGEWPTDDTWPTSFLSLDQKTVQNPSLIWSFLTLWFLQWPRSKCNK